MALGTTGLTAAIGLLMVIAPASAGVAPSKVLTAPYKGTVSSPNGYTDFSGCGKAKTTAPLWHPTTGVVTGAIATSAKTCGKALGYVGGSSYASGSFGMEIGVPFTVGSNGNHTVSSSWAISMATSASYSASPVCSKNINYYPALYQSSYSYCEAGTYLSFEVYSQVQDLNNNSWYGNYSYADTYNDTYFENYTDCYNYGTPTCYNGTSGSFAYSYGYNEVGANTLTWNGASSVQLWNNGTNMVKGHHYVLVLQVYASTEAYAESANLLAPWAGSATASMNLATLGNGVTINSVTIL